MLKYVICELKDDQIITDLKNAIRNYEEGLILEVRQTLYDITKSIDEFVEMEDKING